MARSSRKEFKASAHTLKTIAADPAYLGAEIGLLHTWGQPLQHHPHVHYVVPGGGLSPDGEKWVSCRPGFFLPKAVLRRLFRGKFLALSPVHTPPAESAASAYGSGR